MLDATVFSHYIYTNNIWELIVDSIPILKWPVPLQQIIFVMVFYILILISASGTEPGTL
jgi:hypothetical protein